MGQDLVLFRTRDAAATPVVLDAYCPHLGAHLGVGGSVVGDCLQCPFHGWRFGPDGRCVDIPYAPPGTSIPAQARTRAWRVVETHRSVLLWFDAEGREPSYTLQDAWPQIPADYVERGSVVHHIAAHISEVPENGADVAHLNVLHTAVHPVLRWIQSLVDARFVWTATWEPSAQHAAFTDMTLTERLLVGGRSVPFVASDAVIRQVGPSIVILSLETAWGRVLLLQSIVPLEPYHQRLETVMFVSPNPLNLTLINRLILLAYAENVERDCLIWAKKRYLSAPTVVRGDGPIPRFRKWYAQFYSEHSPTIEAITELKRKNCEPLDW